MNSMMLAQLMQDMKDPEIMKEAQQMMQDPAFQAQMKKMMNQPGFKTHMAKTQEAMKDPEKVKELEAKVETALKEGTEMLKKAQDADEGDDKKKEADGEGDDKEAAPAKKEEEEDMPDIPNLNLN
mmetsp:Transcript_3594/g.9544  ORF Transcript_3594/g.9544 Transcript_3594/m.9544 type:complete len:125 (-) Transcript_3594:98-472(-)